MDHEPRSTDHESRFTDHEPLNVFACYSGTNKFYDIEKNVLITFCIVPAISSHIYMTFYSIDDIVPLSAWDSNEKCFITSNEFKNFNEIRFFILYGDFCGFDIDSEAFKKAFFNVTPVHYHMRLINTSSLNWPHIGKYELKTFEI